MTLVDITENYLILTKLMEYLGENEVMKLVCLNKPIFWNVKKHSKTKEMAQHGLQYEIVENYWKTFKLRSTDNDRFHSGLGRLNRFHVAARLGFMRLVRKFQPSNVLFDFTQNERLYK